MKTLIIIDVQNDFIPGGTLPVPEAAEIIPVINSLQKEFELVIATQDWHPENHFSFAVNHEDKTEFEKIEWEGGEQVLWPTHCVQRSWGAKFHPELRTTKIETIFRKGTNPEIDSYSGFYDNAHLKSTGLAGYLREKGAQELYFCGLAADICVYYSIMDALKEGFQAYLIEDASKALNAEAYEKAQQNIVEKGGIIINSKDILPQEAF